MLDFSKLFVCPKCGKEHFNGDAICDYRWNLDLGPCLVVKCSRCSYGDNMRCKDVQENLDNNDLVICDHEKFGPCNHVDCEYRNPHGVDEVVACNSYQPMKYKGTPDEEV